MYISRPPHLGDNGVACSRPPDSNRKASLRLKTRGLRYAYFCTVRVVRCGYFKGSDAPLSVMGASISLDGGFTPWGSTWCAEVPNAGEASAPPIK